MPAESLRHLEEVRGLVAEIQRLDWFLQGSLSVVMRRCGRAGCRCVEGAGHPGAYFTYKRDGRSRSVYVPAERVDEVRQGVTNHRRLVALVQAMTDHATAALRRRPWPRRAPAPRPRRGAR